MSSFGDRFMGDLKASPLHLISAIINMPRFHREVVECPTEITERCVHLLTALGRSREVAIQTNYEMIEFLGEVITPFDDVGYMRVSRHFVRELLRVVGPQHKLWGAVSYIMLSAIPHLTQDSQRALWMDLNARFFEVLWDSGVISNEEEKRLKLKSTRGEVEPQPDLEFNEVSGYDATRQTVANRYPPSSTEPMTRVNPEQGSDVATNQAVSQEIDPAIATLSESEPLDESAAALQLLGGEDSDLLTKKLTQKRVQRETYPGVVKGSPNQASTGVRAHGETSLEPSLTEQISAEQISAHPTAQAHPTEKMAEEVDQVSGAPQESTDGLKPTSLSSSSPIIGRDIKVAKVRPAFGNRS